jgi:hypothetical protein
MHRRDDGEGFQDVVEGIAREININKRKEGEEETLAGEVM